MHVKTSEYMLLFQFEIHPHVHAFLYTVQLDLNLSENRVW